MPSQSGGRQRSHPLILTPKQNYGISVVFIGIFPLAPIIVEWVTQGKVITEDSLVITAAIYTVAIALASNNPFYFALGIFISFVEAALYGSVVKADATSNQLTEQHVLGFITISSDGSSSSLHIWPLFAILLPFLSFLIERRTRHIKNEEEFFEFLKGKG